MKKVLVTGAQGYAGAAIASALAGAGHQVITAGRHRANDVQFDLLAPESIAALALPDDLAACVHVAAAHEVVCRNDPQQAMQANVVATRLLVERCKRAGVGQMIYLSTFHVYGQLAGQIDETTPVTPCNDYGLTHWLAEEVLRAAARQGGPAVHVLRPANLYGSPRAWPGFDRWTLAPFDFVRQAVRTGQITLLSDGSPRRDYVALETLGAAVLEALAGQAPPLRHLGGQSWSMAELARLAAQEVGALRARPVEVVLGSVRPQEGAYVFGSTHPAPAAPAQDMAAFLQALARHLILEQQA